MGADFCMAKFPRFTFNETRKGEFRQALESVTEDDKEYLRDYFYFDDESDSSVIEDMLGTIKEASDLVTRETGEWSEYDENGNTVYLTYSGGMSWGDNPTEAFAILSKASHLESIYNLAMKFSAEDITYSVRNRSRA